MTRATGRPHLATVPTGRGARRSAERFTRKTILALSATLALGMPASVPARVVDTGHWHQRHWQLETWHDRFRDSTACRLSNPRHSLGYVAGALHVLIPGATPMDKAAYRVDGGPARLVRDDLPTLMQQHVPVDRGNMDHPSGHLAWIPFDRIATAKRLEIQAWPGAHARPVDIAGLAALRRTAAEHGCADDRLFVE
jgi:hypothetical protein